MSNFRNDTDEYVVIKHKKPSKKEFAANPNVNYYAGFRIHKKNGPYLHNSKWCIDTKYWGKMGNTYAIPLADILNDTVKKVHDAVIENICNETWNNDFIEWFCRFAVPQPILHSINDVIFSSKKYILVSWIANDKQRLCWNGFNSNFYIRNAMLYGGKEINVHSSIHTQQFVFKADSPMYYASNTSQSVANNFYQITSRILSLSHHDKKQTMIETLYLWLRKIRTYHLKHHKFGKEKEIQIPIAYGLFVPHMADILNSKNVYYERSEKDFFFNINDTLGDSIFQENLFSKMFGNDKVFCYSIEFIHKTKSNHLTINYYVLQQDQSKPKQPILGYAIVNKSK